MLRFGHDRRNQQNFNQMLHEGMGTAFLPGVQIVPGLKGIKQGNGIDRAELAVVSAATLPMTRLRSRGFRSLSNWVISNRFVPPVASRIRSHMAASDCRQAWVAWVHQMT